MNIEVFKIVYRLSERFKTDEDRFWKLIVELFIVEGFQSIQLGVLAPKFEAYYGRKANYTGKMRSLVSSPEFADICKIVQIDSTVNIEPSDTIKLVKQGLNGATSAAHASQNQGVQYNNTNRNTISNAGDVILSHERIDKVSLIHADPDAVVTIRSHDINPNNPFLEKSRGLDNNSNTNNNNITLSESQNNPFVTLAQVEQQILSKIGNDQSDGQLNNINNTNNESDSIPEEEIKVIEDSESERFGSMVLEELTCLFCMEILKQAVETSCCKALSCYECTEKMIKMRKVRNSCPVCRAQEIQWIPNEPIRRILSKKPTKCDIEGCNTWSTFGEISQHKVTCEYRLVDCENVQNGCDYRAIAKLLAEHSSTCQFQVIPCPYCDTNMLRRELNSHEHVCPLKPAQCNICNRFFAKSDLNGHKVNCDHKKMRCKNGCKELIPKKDLHKHETEECPLRRIHCPNQGCTVRDLVPKIESHLLQCIHRVIPCTNDGCKVLMTAVKMNDHLKSCKFRIVPCHNKDCHEKIRWNSMASHLSNYCQFRAVKCKFNSCNKHVAFVTLKMHEKTCEWKPTVCPNGCGAQMAFNKLENHLPTCNHRKVPCTNEKCREQVQVKDITQHLEDKCQFTVLKCQNEGCTERFERLDLIQHQKTCPFKKCPCSHVGCDQVLTPAELHQHEEICPHRKFKCPNAGCNQLFKQKELYVHVKSCQFKQLPCPNEGCPFKGLGNDISKHLRSCKFRDTKCRHKGCGAFVKKIDLEKHEEECQHALWNCRIDGCSVVVKKSTCNFKLKQ